MISSVNAASSMGFGFKPCSLRFSISSKYAAYKLMGNSTFRICFSPNMTLRPMGLDRIISHSVYLCMQSRFEVQELCHKGCERSDLLLNFGIPSKQNSRKSQ